MIEGAHAQSQIQEANKTMSQVIYGVFEDRTQAEGAIDAIAAEKGKEGVNALVHEGHLRDEDVQMGGTLAFEGAVAGALVVGIVAAIIGVALLIPNANLSIGWTEFLFIALGGTIMGVTAGAVAGASEPRTELISMAKCLEEGKVLVTMDTELPPSEVIDLFSTHGAIEVRAA